MLDENDGQKQRDSLLWILCSVDWQLLTKVLGQTIKLLVPASRVTLLES